jgi:glycosyltransferase involved in cell wall biosynthesis
MRIAIVQAGLSAGGTERVVSLVAGDRCLRRDEVHLFAFVQANEKSYFPLHPNVIVHRLVENEGSWLCGIGLVRSLMRVVALRSEFKKLRPDLVVSFLTKINILCLLATRWLKIPVIISERNNPKVQEKHLLWRLISGTILRRASVLVMQTKAIADTLPLDLKKKAVVIGNPCNAFELQQHGLNLESFQIVATGRLVGQKGFDVLVDAFAEIASQYPLWGLTIYGEGPDRDKLQDKVAAMDLQDRIRLPGVTQRAGDWVGRASLFVLSSRYEGFPNVLIEAMAAGLPVISTECDFGPSEIVESGVSGLLVPVDDVFELAAAMKRLIDDETFRRELGRSASQAVKRFSTEAIMDKWDACFQQIVRDRKAV